MSQKIIISHGKNHKRIPCYKIYVLDGDEILIETKNVYDNDPFRFIDRMRNALDLAQVEEHPRPDELVAGRDFTDGY